MEHRKIFRTEEIKKIEHDDCDLIRLFINAQRLIRFWGIHFGWQKKGLFARCSTNSLLGDGLSQTRFSIVFIVPFYDYRYFRLMSIPIA